MLYGNRAFLVGPTDRADEPRGSGCSTGCAMPGCSSSPSSATPSSTCEATPNGRSGRFRSALSRSCFDADVAHDARSFLFHRSQSAEWNEDGTIMVRFRAGGIEEMCWHLITWVESVAVEKPLRLRRRLAEMCESLAFHHGPRG